MGPFRDVLHDGCKALQNGSKKGDYAGEAAATLAAMSLRILIIEDVPANMALTASILQGAGHAPMQAADALTGLEMARDGSPDLILMDIQLPGMDGLAATRLLKDDARTRNVPVVALTAYAMKGDEDRMRAAGCDGYVAKPIRYRELLAAIDAALPQG